MVAQAGPLNLTYQVESNATPTGYEAAPTIVGVTSTATIAGGGNPIYAATAPKYAGVVALIMDEGAAGLFICSGALLNDRRSILTAGHCVSHGAGTAGPVATTAYFYGGGNPDQVVALNAAATAVAIDNIFVHPDYTGEVIDDNDIAIVTLNTFAPAFATSYDLFTGDAVGQEYNIAGYGRRSDTGGNVGANLGTGRLRQGDNRFDFTLGDAAFGGFFDGGPGGFFGTAQNSHVLISDFDNGRSANDASCILSTSGFGNAPDAQFCNLGVGALEVSSAPGDSGGPQFINGKIASVTSFGLSFGTGFGDISAGLNDSFGEFNGFTPVSTHLDFIAAAQAAIPEPGSWSLMIVGFGLIGSAARRRRVALAA